MYYIAYHRVLKNDSKSLILRFQPHYPTSYPTFHSNSKSNYETFLKDFDPLCFKSEAEWLFTHFVINELRWKTNKMWRTGDCWDGCWELIACAVCLQNLFIFFHSFFLIGKIVMKGHNNHNSRQTFCWVNHVFVRLFYYPPVHINHAHFSTLVQKYHPRPASDVKQDHASPNST